MSTVTDSARAPVENDRSSVAREVFQWLQDSAGGERGLEYARSALDWCRRLPKLADRLPADLWQDLLKHLVQTSVEAAETVPIFVSAKMGLSPSGQDHTDTTNSATFPPNPLVHQLLAGELPMSLAFLFPKIKTCRRLRPQARRALSAGIANLLDGEGLLHARHLDRLRPLLACWTRCRALADRQKRRCWSRKTDTRYRQFVRNALRLARRDGSQVFSGDCPNPPGDCPDFSGDCPDFCLSKNGTVPFDAHEDLGTGSEPEHIDLAKTVSSKVPVRISSHNAQQDIALLEAAVAAGGDRHDRAIASLMLPGGKKKRREPTAVKQPLPAIHSEWAAVAVMRPDWSRSAPRLTVLYPGKSCRVELGCGNDVLWSGEWSFDVRLDGMPALPVSDWFETCWLSDGDLDYLELEIELDQNLRLQRHFVMARKDRFLLLADAVLGTERASLDYCGTLPLGSQAQFRRALETREGVLLGQKARALAIPLALPEWLDDAPGQLQSCETTLELRQTAIGSSLFAPLFFDLDRRRFAMPLARILSRFVQAAPHDCKKCGLTWRQLTVAESLAIQPPDRAVGYRVSVGGKQWLIYRSLTPPRNRTLLGHNLSGEMLVARFQRDGEIKSLIEIE